MTLLNNGYYLYEKLTTMDAVKRIVTALVNKLHGKDISYIVDEMKDDKEDQENKEDKQNKDETKRSDRTVVIKKKKTENENQATTITTTKTTKQESNETNVGVQNVDKTSTEKNLSKVQEKWQTSQGRYRKQAEENRKLREQYRQDQIHI